MSPLELQTKTYYLENKLLQILSTVPLKTRNPVTIWYTIVSIGRIHGFARFFMDADGKIRSFKFTIISMDPFPGF